MRLALTVLGAVMIAASLPTALAQYPTATSPDPAKVAKLQSAIARYEAQREWHEARIELRSLLRLYEGNPAMEAQVCNSIAQVSMQLNDSGSAASYTAQAQRYSAQATGAPAAVPPPYAPAAPYPAASSYSATPQAMALPTTQPMPSGPPVAQGAPVANPNSGGSKFARFMAGANQILDQAQRLSRQQQGGAGPGAQPGPQASGYPAAPSGYPAAPSGYPAAPGAYPAAPGGYPAAPAQPPAPVASGGVVVGYDANNQPIFAAPQPGVGAAPAAAGVVIGYDANNQPIFAAAAPR